MARQPYSRAVNDPAYRASRGPGTQFSRELRKLFLITGGHRGEGRGAGYLAPLAPERAARLEEQAVIAGIPGWAVSEEEIDAGVWAAAAAVRDRAGTVAALSVPSPLVRAPEALHEELLAQVRAAAQEISASLAGAHR